MSQLGNRIRVLRQQRGDSQEAVARRADIATGTYSRIENGLNEPSFSTLVKIAAALEVSLDELAGTTAA
jgi:transcriptional regulator with XRE-family HTH domain